MEPHSQGPTPAGPQSTSLSVSKTLPRLRHLPLRPWSLVVALQVSRIGSVFRPGQACSVCPALTGPLPLRRACRAVRRGADSERTPGASVPVLSPQLLARSGRGSGPVAEQGVAGPEETTGAGDACLAGDLAGSAEGRQQGSLDRPGGVGLPQPPPWRREAGRNSCDGASRWETGPGTVGASDPALTALARRLRLCPPEAGASWPHVAGSGSGRPGAPL